MTGQSECVRSCYRASGSGWRVDGDRWFYLEGEGARYSDTELKCGDGYDEQGSIEVTMILVV